METSSELRHEVNRTYDEILRLRDEVRVRLHLAAMDIRDEWDSIQPRFAEAERLAREASEASRAALRSFAEEIRKIRLKIAS